MADYDLIIIGGGPAGLTAGLYAARANMNVVLFEGKDIGGELLNTDLIEDWPGDESVTGRELAERMGAHATKFGLKIQPYSPVKKIRSDGDWKVVEMDDGRDGALEHIPVGGVFVFIGFKPVGRHLFDEHIDHDENGYLLTDQYMRTNIPGVYACGDTRAQLAKQVTTAVGDATTAVLHAERYIEELKHMRRSFPDVPSATLEREVERLKLRRFLAGQTLIREGAPADSFFILP